MEEIAEEKNDSCAPKRPSLKVSLPVELYYKQLRLQKCLTGVMLTPPPSPVFSTIAGKGGTLVQSNPKRKLENSDNYNMERIKLTKSKNKKTIPDNDETMDMKMDSTNDKE
ncbi:unnamed protein product, partial [Iphiclides podalirius]